MLSLQDLRELLGQARDEWVLSAYISADEHDPAMRGAWRVWLKGKLDALRAAVPATESQRAFDQARRHLEAVLEPFEGFLPGPGWVGLATAEGLLYAGSISAPMPQLVRWRHGPFIGPYVRALKHARPVVVALASGREAYIYTYQHGRLSEVRHLSAERFVGDRTDAHMSKRAKSRSGVRGKTGTDAAARSHTVGTRRMLSSVADEVRSRAGTDGLVIVGAAAETANEAAQFLRPVFGPRLLIDTALHLDLPKAWVLEGVAADASALTRGLQKTLVAQILDSAGAGQAGYLGKDAVEHALRKGQVAELALSARFLTEQPEAAERLARLALDSAAKIEHINGPGAACLDVEAGGVGARLRYRQRLAAGTASPATGVGAHGAAAS